jgi:expansin (peptidoglycan-binding protein)
MICAVSHLVYDAASTSGNPNENPLCGKKLRIERVDERDGRKHSIDVTVVDRCVGCKANDIDLSPSAFDKLADEALGRVKGSWAWLN